MSWYDFGTGGFDIEFDAPALSNGQAVSIKADIGILEDDTIENAMSYTVIGKSGGVYYVEIIDREGVSQDLFWAGFITNMGHCRIVWHNEFCTIYIDGVWVHTFAFKKVFHNVVPTVYMRYTGGPNLTVTNIRLKELADWREAIFIDMETTSQNALSTVILQRPIEMYPTYDGGMRFVYQPDRLSAPVKFVRSKNYEEVDSSTAASDAIVYFTNVAVTIDEDYAEDVGFVTRMYRFPDLDNGAVLAAQIIQRKSRQQESMHQIEARYSPRFEIGDIAQVNYITAGPQKVVAKEVIIEGLSINIEPGRNRMQITGRENI